MTSLERTDGNSIGDGSIRPEDAEWLSSLSESELDLLISLKELAIRRATNVGYKHLAEKFDVKMLRALGFIMLEYYKERAQSTSDPNLAGISTMFGNSGLSKLKFENSIASSKSSMTDTCPLSFVNPRRKQMWEGLCEETARHPKRQKTTKPEV